MCSKLHSLCPSSGSSSCGGKFPAQKRVNPVCMLRGSRDPEFSRPSPDQHKECEKFCFGIHEVLSRIWEQFLLCSFGVFLSMKYTFSPFLWPMCSSRRNSNSTYVPTTYLEIEHSRGLRSPGYPSLKPSSLPVSKTTAFQNICQQLLLYFYYLSLHLHITYCLVSPSYKLHMTKLFSM